MNFASGLFFLAGAHGLSLSNEVGHIIVKSWSLSSLSDIEPFDSLFRQVEEVEDNVRLVDNEREYTFLHDAVASLATIEKNSKAIAQWLESLGPETTLYIGFEAFYNDNWESAVSDLDFQLQFSPLVQNTHEYAADEARYSAMTASGDSIRDDGIIVFLGSSHVMDQLLFQENHLPLQKAWREGRLFILGPNLAIGDRGSFRASLSMVLAELGHDKFIKKPKKGQLQKKKEQRDYILIDYEVAATKKKIDAADSMEGCIGAVLELIARFTIADNSLDAPLYFDVGLETFHLMKKIMFRLNKKDKRLPLSRGALVQARNAAIGDAVHSFYGANPDAFPVVIAGDTACLLAGGISLMNIFSKQRFGAIIILNNQGMAIEDQLSRRQVDGHSFSYEYVKLDKKRDVFTLDQLKDALKDGILTAWRDYLWGISATRAEVTIINIDTRMLEKASTPERSSFISPDFGSRFQVMSKERTKLEALVSALHAELADPAQPVRIQGCSAVEYIEIISQLGITQRDQLRFIPQPTDLLATRTLINALTSGPDTPNKAALTINSGHTTDFVVLISNSIFGTDGLNNLIETHLEYGSKTLVHLVYFASDHTTQYSNIGQPHRAFGVSHNAVAHLYSIHQAYESQVVFLDANDPECPQKLRSAIQDDRVRAVCIHMGAPDLASISSV